MTNLKWDFDIWFCSEAPKRLRYLAQKGDAYPGVPPFDTLEKWHSWLEEMAHLLETYTQEYQEAHNSYAYASPNYQARAAYLKEQGLRNAQLALHQLAEHWNYLWD